MRIGILTLSIGEDYTRQMKPGLASKDLYACRWGLKHIVGGEHYYDTTRPVSWSKLRFWLTNLDRADCDYLWLSDADSIITNPEISLADLASRLFTDPDVHGIWWRDAAGNPNAGQMLVRARSAPVRQWFSEADKQTDLTDDPWWDNAALIRVWRESVYVGPHVKLREDHNLLNAYVGAYASTWDPSCFVLHYAGHRNLEWVHRHMLAVRPDLMAQRSVL